MRRNKTPKNGIIRARGLRKVRLLTGRAFWDENVHVVRLSR